MKLVILIKQSNLNSGNHGDGHPDCTRTPIIAWGSGIGAPMKGYNSEITAESTNWSLTEYKQLDVEQADIAPLMVIQCELICYI